MNSNMTFRIDNEIKAQMTQICKELGMSTSTAFNIFANAFVRAKGMPFEVIVKETKPTKSDEILADVDSILNEFEEDYRRMAEWFG